MCCISSVFSGKVYAQDPKKPNIILVTLCSLRADHLGSYGYPLNTSPFIDSIAKESFVFKNCISQGGNSLESLASIFTSKFQFTDNILLHQELAPDKEYYILGEHLTMASFLKQKGYTTVGIPGSFFTQKKFGLSKGFDYYNDRYEHLGQEYGRIARDPDEYLAPIQKIFQQIDISNDPLFLWIHMNDPHAPYDPPDEYKAKFLQPFTGIKKRKVAYQIAGKREMIPGYEVNRMIANYDGDIRWADDNLRKIFGFFEKKNILEDSIIIVTSDHGESLGEHHLFDHNHLYYGITHVPLIVRIPGKEARVIHDPVSSVDIFRTIIELLGYKNEISKLNLRGENLFKKRASNYFQYSENDIWRSVVQQGWKMYFDTKPKELYNITVDPDEKFNVIDENPDVLASLLNLLEGVVGETNNDTEPAFDIKNNLSEEEIKNLQSLGYW